MSASEAARIPIASVERAEEGIQRLILSRGLARLDPVALGAAFGAVAGLGLFIATAVLLLRAMIAAALSDGRIDAEERQRIVGRLGDMGVGAEERQFLDREIAAPWSPQQFAQAAQTPEMRSEIYLASSIAIEADTAAEQAYLRYLAATLGLEEGLVAHLDAAVASAKAPATSVPQVRIANG